MQWRGVSWTIDARDRRAITEGSDCLGVWAQPGRSRLRLESVRKIIDRGVTAPLHRADGNPIQMLRPVAPALDGEHQRFICLRPMAPGLSVDRRLAMSENTRKECRVQGTVAPGFEPVKRLYEHEMRGLAEENTQLCIYYRGERVVDLWASVWSDGRFTPDSIVNVFSSGKSLEAIAMASLVGRGLLDYEDKVVAHWPEFGANGKGDISVAEVLRHEGGLAASPRPSTPKIFFPKGSSRMPSARSLPASLSDSARAAVVDGNITPLPVAGF